MAPMKTTFPFSRSVCSKCGRARVQFAMIASVLLFTLGRAPGEEHASVLLREHPSTPAIQPQHPGAPGIFQDHPEASPYSPDLEAQSPWEPGLAFSGNEGCPPAWRGRAEWLQFTRSESGDSLTSAFTFDDFDYQQGVRFTLDRRWDCTHGWEFVYAGLSDWRQETVAAGAGTLNATLTAGPGVSLSAFFSADSQQQIYDSDLHSFEAAYKCWGWNVIAVGWGSRYINLDEQLLFRSESAVNGIGLVQVATENHLVLSQVGVDMMFPLGRWSFDSSWKAALGANLGDSRVLVSNGGATQLFRRDEDIEFAALIEGATYLRFFVTPRLAVRAGYEFWYIYGVGLAPGQLDLTISSQTGRDFRGDNDILIHGFSVGVEYGW
jgi:hypothetical protein